MSAAKTVCLYVTGHGFGHAVRSAELARELLARGARVLVRTDAPAWLFPSEVERLPDPGWPVDVGVVQKDGLELDVDATRAAWIAFGAKLDEHADREAATLRETGVDVVVGDVPPLGFLAASQAGIPGVAVANFGWDWIYAPWPGFEGITERIREAYARADLLLRLPLHSTEPDAFPAFRCMEDVPLVARSIPHDAAAARVHFGLPADATLVLLSFGGFDIAGVDLQALGSSPRYTFVLTRLIQTEGPVPANVRLLPLERPDYASLVAASNVVVTKPGYGIVADCLASHVPVLYTDRGPFREYPILAAALEASGPAVYVPQADVRAGRLADYLEQLERKPREWHTPPLDGASVAAERVLALL